MSRLTDIRDLIGFPLGAPRFDGCSFYVTTGRTQYEPAINKQNFIVVATVGESNEENREKLDELLDGIGPLSVKRVIEANPTPHRDVIDIRVLATSGMRLYPSENGDGPQLGAEWTVECLLEGD